MALHGDGKLTSNEMLHFSWDMNAVFEDQRNKLRRVLELILDDPETRIRDELVNEARNTMIAVKEDTNYIPPVDVGDKWVLLKEAVDAYHKGIADRDRMRAEEWRLEDRMDGRPYKERYDEFDTAVRESIKIDGAKAEACIHIKGIIQWLERGDPENGIQATDD